MIVPYTNLYDEVLPDVPGVTPAVALNAIRNACIEFCSKSNIWVVDHDPIASIADEPVYQFEPPNGTVVSSVVVARFAGFELDPATQGELSEEYGDWQSKSGTPEYFIQENSEELILCPKPIAAVADALKMKVSLKPSRKSTGIEGWIVESYQEELAHGAKAKLFAMNKKPWSSAELAGFHLSAFEAAIAAAKMAAAKSLGRGKLRTKPQFF